MYKLPHFSTTDKEKMLVFMQQHAFAMVTGMGSVYPVATQLPLVIIEENESLFFKGHLMKKTDHHLAFTNNPNVLVLFTSPSAYIDANWYTQKPVGSTVNYITVHAKGKITFTDDEGTYQAVKSITEKHIQPNTDAAFSNIPQSYIDAMVKAIVGFSIEVTALDAVFKLSQNQSALDRQNIIGKLIERNEDGDVFIAREMQKFKNTL